MTVTSVGNLVDGAEHTIEVGVRDLRNHTRDVVELLERGWSVYLTTHGRRIAILSPVADSAVAPRLAALLKELDEDQPYDSGILDLIRASRAAEVETDPWA
jgi:antitoxin (DNA-binding transcriptional repressor) of toxin-antitoxin stability system